MTPLEIMARGISANSGFALGGCMDAASEHDKQTKAQAKAALQALDAAGWVVVPKEATENMRNAAIDVDSFKLGDISPLGFRESPQMLFGRCYDAMIEAGVYKV